jgi:hypothetical protein
MHLAIVSPHPLTLQPGFDSARGSSGCRVNCPCFSGESTVNPGGFMHALREEETDLRLADYSRAARTRPKTDQNEEGVSDGIANPSNLLVELGGIEPPTLRLPVVPMVIDRRCLALS